MITSSGCGSSVKEKGVRQILLLHLNVEKIIEGEKLLQTATRFNDFQVTLCFFLSPVLFHYMFAVAKVKPKKYLYSVP